MFCRHNAGQTSAGRGGTDSVSEKTQRNSDAEFLVTEFTGGGVSRSRSSEAPVVLTNDMKLRKGQGGLAGVASAAKDTATVAVMTVAQIDEACSKASKAEAVMERVRGMSPEQSKKQVCT